jgi:hypothetical protein
MRAPYRRVSAELQCIQDRILVRGSALLRRSQFKGLIDRRRPLDLNVNACDIIVQPMLLWPFAEVNCST